jgi:hypothetical protein
MLPLIRVTGNAPGAILHRLHFQLVGKRLAVMLEALSLPEDGRSVILSDCVIQGDRAKMQIGIVVSGNPSWGVTRGICVRENSISGVLQGIQLVGSVTSVQLTGNRIWSCREAGIQIEDLALASEHLLLANNTVVGCSCAVRIWENKWDIEHRKGQVEVANNLLADAEHGDMAYYLQQSNQTRPGNGEALFKLWSCHHNRRDGWGSAVSYLIPLAAADRRADLGDLVSQDLRQPDQLRPRKASPLATQGAGTQDGSLPHYIGALPPEDSPAWDWEKTWRARLRRTLPPQPARTRKRKIAPE